jgi:hypothetical protein
LPGITTDPAVFPDPEAVCLASSLPHDGTGADWDWSLVSSTDDDPREETLGIREHLYRDFRGSFGILPTEIERSRIPGFEDGFGFVWQRMSPRVRWEDHRDLTAAEFEQRSRAARDAGLRAADIEAYSTPNGTRYAGIWVENTEGAAWQVEYDLTDEAYGQAFRRHRDEGFRLVDYESYETVDGVRYAGVWAENDARYDLPFRVALDDSIQAYRTRHGIPGISVVVMQGDQVVYRRGFGWADSTLQKRAHAGTIYLAASVSKVIGATVAARMEQREDLDLDLSRPTREFLEDLPRDHTHTVEQLLAKVGCIGHYNEVNEPDTATTYTWRASAVSQMRRSAVLPGCTPGNPGRQYHYSTHGFTFVGAVLEEVADKPIGQIITDELRLFQLPSIRVLTSGRYGGFGELGVRPYHLSRAYTRCWAEDYRPTPWTWLGSATSPAWIGLRIRHVSGRL